MYGELEMMRKEVGVAYFKELSWNLPEKLRKTLET
jgi:hypothetical protein